MAQTTAQRKNDRSIGPFAWAIIWTIGTWFALTCLLLALLAWLKPDLMRECISIAIGSGFIATASLVPGWTAYQWRDVAPTGSKATMGKDKNESENYINAHLSGMILRLVGTVALFAMCRYQMAASEQWIAGLILTYYVTLTLVEITSLVFNLSRTNHSKKQLVNAGFIAGVATQVEIVS